MHINYILLPLLFVNTSLFAANSEPQAAINPTNKSASNTPSAPSTLATPQAPTLYTYPGFVFLRNGEWTGSDYLYNLQNDIGLALDVFAPENESVDASQQKLLDTAINSFRLNRLTPRVNPAPGVNSLPFFYVQIMIFPTELGNVATVSGSLFETVTLARIPTQGTLQFKRLPGRNRQCL